MNESVLPPAAGLVSRPATGEPGRFGGPSGSALRRPRVDSRPMKLPSTARQVDPHPWPALDHDKKGPAAGRFSLDRQAAEFENSRLPGAIAQMGERYNGIVEVGGSIPPGSTRVHAGRSCRMAYGIRPHRLEAQDTALSRRRRGFDSPWGRQYLIFATFKCAWNDAKRPVSGGPGVSRVALQAFVSSIGNGGCRPGAGSPRRRWLAPDFGLPPLPGPELVSCPATGEPGLFGRPSGRAIRRLRVGSGLM